MLFLIIFIIVYIGLFFIIYLLTTFKSGCCKNYKDFYQNKITHYTILGERCSGTFFLQEAMEKNFKLKLTWDYGWKHWFGNHQDYKNSSHVLFLVMYRHPLDWLNSLYHDQHHLHPSMKDEKNFLSKPIINYNLADLQEIPNSRNPYNAEPLENIFKLRETKLHYLLYEFPKKVEFCEILHYELLKEDYIFILNNLRQKYNLEIKNPKFPIPIAYKIRGGQKLLNIDGQSNRKKHFHNDYCKFFNKELEEIAGYII